MVYPGFRTAFEIYRWNKLGCMRVHIQEDINNLMHTEELLIGM